jgi:6-phosphogluconolactonase
LEAASPAAFAVREAPKPPPERVSLTLGTINAAREVWLVAAGEPKREAVTRALAGGPAVPPAGRVAGTEATFWLIDLAAAPAAVPPANQPGPGS